MTTISSNDAGDQISHSNCSLPFDRVASSTGDQAQLHLHKAGGSNGKPNRMAIVCICLLSRSSSFEFHATCETILAVPSYLFTFVSLKKPETVFLGIVLSDEYVLPPHPQLTLTDSAGSQLLFHSLCFVPSSRTFFHPFNF